MCYSNKLYQLALLPLMSMALLSLGCEDPCATEANEVLLEAAAAEEGAIRTESGLVFLELIRGTGPQPQATSTVQVHYEGRLTSGKVFDSSRRRGPAKFKLNEVIPGWTEGLQLLKGGGRAKLTIPAGLAYGSKGKRGTIPPCTVLVFDVELLGISD
jgi:FKBP-type peptidyl-prolyl cis-trans isomerase